MKELKICTNLEEVRYLMNIKEDFKIENFSVYNGDYYFLVSYTIGGDDYE